MLIHETKTRLGEHKISVLDLFKNQDLVAKTGIENVYETKNNTVDLALLACEKLEFDKKLINLLVFVTQSPDYYLPSSSIILASKYQINKNCLTFDINQGCSGFVQALCVVEKLTKSYNNILLVTADRYRSKLDKSDRSTNAVFSDGASANIILHDDNHGIIYEDHFVDGSYKKLLYQSTNSDENKGFLHMSGAEIWVFTRLNVVPQIEKAYKFCEENKLEIEGVYIHQASKVVVDGIKSLLPKISEKIYENYQKIGNTVSSSIPFLLNDFKINLKKQNSVIILAGFGVGLTSTVLIYGKKN